MLVDTVAGVHAAQRRIRKIPLAGIETIPLVNERRLVCRSALRLAAEYCLTPICIARPFIEHDHSRKIFDIRDLLQQAFRQVVEQLAFNRICGVCGSQVQTCFERCS